MLRLVCTADTHFPFDKSMIPDGDVFIHAGDLMYSGQVGEWYERLASLEALPHERKLYIPGNHDFHMQNYEGVAVAELKSAGVEVLGLKHLVTEIDGITFLGLPWVTELRGWAFNVDESFIADVLTVVDNVLPNVVISHAPVRGILDAIHPEQRRYKGQGHVGCLAYRRWFDALEYKPQHWINGHIHESYGQTIKDVCQFRNVSMCNREYKQTNPPMVIDL